MPVVVSTTVPSDLVSVLVTEPSALVMVLVLLAEEEPPPPEEEPLLLAALTLTVRVKS